MHLANPLLLAPSLLLLLATPIISNAVPAKPRLTKLFTASLTLGQALKPIAIPGGIRLVEPIASGTLSGPALTGTVTGGVAYPIFYEGMKFEQPDIIVYGNTDKNGSFFATLGGVGSAVDQFVRIVVDVGPPYSRLNETFILGEILRGEGGSTTVNAYEVEHK